MKKGALIKKSNRFPAFSVLITVYSKEKPEFLENSIKSVINQTVVPNQIIIVEDGKLTSELEKVIENHKKSFFNNFTIVKLDKNMGRGIASNAGIEKATNEWIAKMDSDDISKPDRFEIQLNAIQKHPEAVAIGGQVEEFIENQSHVISKREVPLDSESIFKFAKYRSPVNNPTVMFKKSVVKELGEYSNLRFLEDYDLWVKMLTAGFKIVNVPETLVDMRMSDSLYSRRGGFKYLFVYIKLKDKWRRMGLGNYLSVFTSDVAMFLNTLIPTKIRKVIYKQVLRRK